jgi:hypothetical protein
VKWKRRYDRIENQEYLTQRAIIVSLLDEGPEGGALDSGQNLRKIPLRKRRKSMREIANVSALVSVNCNLETSFFARFLFTFLSFLSSLSVGQQPRLEW